MNAGTYASGLDVLGAQPAPSINYWNDIPIGSLLKRKDVHVGSVWHFGIKVDYWNVLHIDKDERTGRIRFRLDTFDGFAASRNVLLDQPAPSLGLETHTIYQRAREVDRSSASFGLLSLGEDWNCEDVARFLATGVKRSVQAETAVNTTLVAAALGFLFYIAKDG